MEQAYINFMPGPVNLHPEVKKIYHDTFLSHRSEKFYTDVKDFQKKLCDFVKAQNVAFFVGSGSLGNEVTAQYLKQLGGKGLILVNGEFGKRLKEQAAHIELAFETLEYQLGEAFDYDKADEVLGNGSFTWLWFVNCETSSGVLNDLNRLKVIAAKHNVKLAVDCISSIGNTEVDLSGVFLASGTSGKGLASYPGISLVFFDDAVPLMETRSVPKYMNIKYHQETNLVPYTISTNLFYALSHAFNGIVNPQHRQNIRLISDYIYEQLALLGFSFLGNYNEMMPGIISIVCPAGKNSYELGLALEKNNFYVNYGGAYLKKGNYFQICIMGHQHMDNAQRLVNFLKTLQVEQALHVAV